MENNYREMNVGEVTQAGDEYLSYDHKTYLPCLLGGHTLGKLDITFRKYRRPIPSVSQEALEYRQHYIFLNQGELIQEDEFYTRNGEWVKVRTVGLPAAQSGEYRRKVATNYPAMA